MKSEMPKQFLKIGGYSVLYHTVSRFLNIPEIIEIIIVGHPEYLNSREMQNSIPAAEIPIHVLAGGAHRQESVYNGLQKVSDEADIVCIHDGVRPLIQTGLIRKSIEFCNEYDGAVIAVPAVDTLKKVEVDGQTVIQTLDRSNVWQAQTPQTFRKSIIENAYRHIRKHEIQGTDDAQLVENLGFRIAVIKGSTMNLKITTPEDLQIATFFLEEETS